MADTEETPAQKQARIRRQKREAKINANAQERLDKITQLSGRTPETRRNETESPTPGAAPSTSPPGPTSMPRPPPPVEAATPEQAQLQEEYLRTLLRGSPQANGQGQGQDAPAQDDPMMQMLSSMMTGMGGEGADPNNPGGMPFNPDELAKQSGLPAWATNMLFGSQKAPPTPAEERSLRWWKVVHAVMAVVIGVYLLFAITKSTQKYGAEPPAPATFQNPFVVFVMAELLLQSTRILTVGQAGQFGPGMVYQMLKQLARDGAIMVFMFGVATWWQGNT